MLGQGAHAPSIEVQRFDQSAFSMANFFQSILSKKTGEVLELETEVKVPFSSVIFLFDESKNSAVLGPRACIFEDCRLRGQGRGLELRGQILQNLCSGTPPLVS